MAELQMPVGLRAVANDIAQRGEAGPIGAPAAAAGEVRAVDDDLESLILIQASVRGMLTRSSTRKTVGGHDQRALGQALRWRQEFDAEQEALLPDAEQVSK